MSVRDEVLQANEAYAASFGKKSALAPPPAPLRHPDLHGCSTRSREICRIERGGRPCDPECGWPRQRRRHSIPGDILQIAGNPGMVCDPSQQLRDGALHRRCHSWVARPAALETARVGTRWLFFRDVGRGPGSAEAKYIDWLTISDNARSVTEDVTRIRDHPLGPGRIAIYGYIYDVATGRLNEIPEATKAGLPV